MRLSFSDSADYKSSSELKTATRENRHCRSQFLPIYQLGKFLKWFKIWLFLFSVLSSFFVSGMLQGPAEEVATARDRKLEAAREARRVKRAHPNQTVEANEVVETWPAEVFLRQAMWRIGLG